MRAIDMDEQELRCYQQAVDANRVVVLHKLGEIERGEFILESAKLNSTGLIPRHVNPYTYDI